MFSQQEQKEKYERVVSQLAVECEKLKEDISDMEMELQASRDSLDRWKGR